VQKGCLREAAARLACGSGAHHNGRRFRKYWQEDTEAASSMLAFTLIETSQACDLQQSADVAWGKLAGELREEFPDLSDLHFAGVVLTTVEAIRELALTMPARTHVDSSARLKISGRCWCTISRRCWANRSRPIHHLSHPGAPATGTPPSLDKTRSQQRRHERSRPVDGMLAQTSGRDVRRAGEAQPSHLTP